MSQGLNITLLGSPQIVLDGRALHFRSIKATALLAYLATTGRPHGRGELAALLWPESDKKRARGALRFTLSLIKKELGDGYLHINRQQLGMNPDANWHADVVAVRDLLTPALNGQPDLTDTELQGVAQAVALHRAHFLQGFYLSDGEPFNEWAFLYREELERDVALALKQLTAVYAHKEQWDTAVSYAHHWLNTNALHEPAHCQLMSLYTELGDWTAVHNQYQALTDLLEKELAVPPQPETTTHYQQLMARQNTKPSTPSTTALSPDQRSRYVLIEKIHRFWVNNLLMPLHEAHRYIQLKFEHTHQYIAHPWADVLDLAQSQPIETTPIVPAFRHANHALLILGDPGSGKTTTLIELCKHLLAIAQEDEAQPVPVILNLSSWAERQEEIGVWAVEEIVAKYQIPRRTGRQWLKEDRLLLLLDGLDEMASAHHAACITAINQFRQTNGLPDVVVCCRRAAYEAVMNTEGVRFELNGAMTIRPLTTTQIRQHMPASLVDAVFQDEHLLDMVQTPLNLDIMRATFEGDDEMQGATAALTYSHLFNLYLQRMIQRQTEKGTAHYEWSQLHNELIWLAQQMQEHNQSLFLLEQIQPSWLTKRCYQWLYLFISHAMMPALTGTIFMWGFVQLIGINPPHIEVQFLSEWGLWGGVLALFGLNLFAVTLSAIANGLFFVWRQWCGDEAVIHRGLGWLQTMVVAGVAGTAVALPLTLTDSLFISLFLGGMATTGVILVFGAFRHGQSFRTEIRLRGALKWSWRNACGLALVGASLALLWSGIVWLNDPTAVATGINTFNMGLLFFLLGGLSGRQPQLQNRPNEGIRIAGRNALRALLLVMLPAILFTAVMVNLASGLYMGIMFGILAATLHGFSDVTKHYTVRGLLWLQRGTPLNYVKMLECATDYVLLQRVGSGYVFRHRLLQEHVAKH